MCCGRKLEVLAATAVDVSDDSDERHGSNWEELQPGKAHCAEWSVTVTHLFLYGLGEENWRFIEQGLLESVAPRGEVTRQPLTKASRFLSQGCTGFLKPLLTSPSHIVGGAFVFFCLPPRSWRRTRLESHRRCVQALGDSPSRVEASWAAFGICVQSRIRQERTSSGFGVSG